MSDRSDFYRRFITFLALTGFEDNMYNGLNPDINAEQILSAMQCLVMNMEPMKLETEKPYYRARCIKAEEIKEEKGFSLESTGHICSGFNNAESGNPPRSLVKAGRFNHEWESIWYLTEEKYTAIAEVRPETRSLVSVAEYKANGCVKILDFSNSTIKMKKEFAAAGSALENYDIQSIYVAMQKAFTLPAYENRTYFISNILADFAKESCVSGIKYKSFYGPGNNIALWDFDEDTLHFQGSKVFLNYCSMQAFIDLEEGKMVDVGNWYYDQINSGFSNVICITEKMYKELLEKNRRKDQ